jgi:hypothetical protein
MRWFTLGFATMPCMCYARFLCCPQVSVSVSAESKSELASIRTAMDELAAQGATDSPEAQRLVNGYRMATGEAKVDSVIEFLRGLPGLQPQGKAAAPGNGADSDGDAPAQAAAAGAGASSAGVGAVLSGKVLVFAHHQGVLDAIETRLCEADGLGYVRIDGRTSGAERQVSSKDCGCDPAWLNTPSLTKAQPAHCLHL